MLAATPPSKRPAPSFPNECSKRTGAAGMTAVLSSLICKFLKQVWPLRPISSMMTGLSSFGDLTLLPIFHLVIRSTG